MFSLLYQPQREARHIRFFLLWLSTLIIPVMHLAVLPVIVVSRNRLACINEQIARRNAWRVFYDRMVLAICECCVINGVELDDDDGQDLCSDSELSVCI